MNATPFNLWKKRNKLSTKEASELLGITENTININNAKNGSFTKCQEKIMELIDENRVLQEKVNQLALKLAENENTPSQNPYRYKNHKTTKPTPID